MNEFERYMQLYEIDPVSLSVLAKVRYLTVYNAQKGHPIMPENANKIKETHSKCLAFPMLGHSCLSN